ncbi:hypothetical protein ACWGOK_42085 [Streptomyces eurythermus]
MDGMTARPIGTEVSCDGPDETVDCPDNAAVRAAFVSVTPRDVRADGREQGWIVRRRNRRFVDLCPQCAASSFVTRP